MVTRTETREERDARLARDSDAADAGAYDHIFQRHRDYLLSQIPDGYVLRDDGHIARTDPDLPADFWIASTYDGKPTGQMVKVTAL